MLLRWDIENPGQLKPFLLPEPQWNGCTYTESEWTATASSQNSASPGNADAKDDFWKEHDAATLLCPSGNCGASPVVAPAPGTPVAESEEERRKAEKERRKARRKAEKERRKAEKKLRRQAEK